MKDRTAEPAPAPAGRESATAIPQRASVAELRAQLGDADHHSQTRDSQGGSSASTARSTPVRLVPSSEERSAPYPPVPDATVDALADLIIAHLKKTQP